MASEVFQRVGRGGAGNWYSKKDVEEADRAALEVPPNLPYYPVANI
jgi:hypothetical protein